MAFKRQTDGGRSVESSMRKQHRLNGEDFLFNASIRHENMESLLLWKKKKATRDALVFGSDEEMKYCKMSRVFSYGRFRFSLSVKIKLSIFKSSSVSELVYPCYSLAPMA